MISHTQYRYVMHMLQCPLIRHTYYVTLLYTIPDVIITLMLTYAAGIKKAFK